MRFRVVLNEKIAVGSHGEVFRGQDLESGSVVAIKVPKQHFLSISENESAMLNTIFSLRSEDFEGAEHSILRPIHIGKVMLGGDESSVDCIVMPLCSFSLGDFLDTVDLNKLDEKTQLSLIYSVFSSLLDAITLLDKLRIHHADIKPGNILWDEQAKKWKLADFGTARIYKPLSPEVNDCGTMQFRAPEYCARYPSEDGPWSDIYSLGKIVALLLDYVEIRNDSNSAHFIDNLNRYTLARETRAQNLVSPRHILAVSQEIELHSLSLRRQFELIAQRGAETLQEDRPTLNELAALRCVIRMHFPDQLVSELLGISLNADFFDAVFYFDDERYCRVNQGVDSHALSIASPVRSPGKTPGSQSRNLTPARFPENSVNTREPEPVVISPVAFFGAAYPVPNGWNQVSLGFERYEEEAPENVVSDEVAVLGLSH